VCVIVFAAVTLERRNANLIFWSPAGQFVVLAGLKG